MNPPAFAPNEQMELEIPPSKKTVGYYSLKAAPLFGFWFIGLITFLIYTYRTTHAPLQQFLFQALALSAFAYLIGSVARWLWRVDVAQRDAWLTNMGIWIQSPSGMQFVPYLQISRVQEKHDWMEKWLHLDEIVIEYLHENNPKKIALVGVENADVVIAHIRSKTQTSA